MWLTRRHPMLLDVTRASESGVRTAPRYRNPVTVLNARMRTTRSAAPLVPLSFVPLGSLLLAGCDPVIDVQGTFFPAWLLCMIVGVVLTVAVRPLLVRLGLEPYLGPLPLIYTCLAVLLTLGTWLVFFRT